MNAGLPKVWVLRKYIFTIEHLKDIENWLKELVV